MDERAIEHPGWLLLRRLRALAVTRRARGDTRLLLSPSPEPQEFREMPLDADAGAAGLVLEPREDAAFEIRPLGPRQKRVRIDAFCDGTRRTYFVGFEDIYPLLYTENSAAVRQREPITGYHGSCFGIQRGQATLLVPFGLLAPPVRLPYERLGLCPTRYADLCWVGDTEERGLTPDEMRRLGSVAWQGQGQRRARRLMEVSEQIAALAGARVLRDQWPDGECWLLKDGSLFQFDRKYLSRDRGEASASRRCGEESPGAVLRRGRRACSRQTAGWRAVGSLPAASARGTNRPATEPSSEAGHQPPADGLVVLAGARSRSRPSQLAERDRAARHRRDRRLGSVGGRGELGDPGPILRPLGPAGPTR